MDKNKLFSVQKSLETFFYKIRFNIGLSHVLDAQEFKSFRASLKKSLRDQILYFAKIEKVNAIIGLKKAVGELTDTELLTNLNKMWIPIFAILDEAEANKFLLWSANKGGQIGLDKLKSTETFKLTNEKIIDSIKKRSVEFSKVIDYTTQSWIARTIEEGINMNLLSVDIAKNLRDESKDIAYFRSDMIAEYEVALQIGDIQNEVFKRSGITHHKWTTTRDERTCMKCVSNEEAGTVEIGDMFPSGTNKSPAHIACRCFTSPASAPKTIWTGN